jgi:BCCT family betaine/carnitine transporter
MAAPKTSDPKPKKTQTDFTVFLTAFIVIAGFTIPIYFFPEQAKTIIVATYDWIANNLGLAYQWAVIGMVVFLGWIALGPHGSLRLGDRDERPEFGYFTWVSMLFCAGVGAGLIYWSTIEWAHYLASPPFGAEPLSREARDWALSYGLFHWGPMAWMIYALPTVAIGYQYYVRGAPNLRFSAALHGMFGSGVTAAIMSRVLDFLFMLSLLAGAGTSIGLAVPMISESLADALGFERTLGTDISVIGACVGLLAIAAYTGLSKGISKLAEFNVLLAFGFLLFILFVGPTLLILRLGTEHIGFMLQNSLRMLFYTDAIERTGFVEDWTIFYWAWWIAFGPFVGLFVTRISRGRTLRDLIIAMAVFGSLGAWMFYVVLGNYAFWLDMSGRVPVGEIVNGEGPARAIAEVIASLPFPPVMLSVFSVISIIFIAATYNSKAYALAASTMRNLAIGQDPPRWNRVFWALVLGLLPIALISVEGGIKVAQSAVLVASLPLLIIGVLMCINLARSLGER